MSWKLLDLFCKAGGCSMGYHRAGFEVTGVDIAPQKNYPFPFVQADALMFPLSGFDVIHASPPCQAYSTASAYLRAKGKKYVDLVAQTRDRLIKSNTHYIIENVQGAPLRHSVRLCGSSFGLGFSEMALIRHRFFESDIMLFVPPCQHGSKPTITICGNGVPTATRDKLGRCFTVAEARESMGIDWMSRLELSQAIPPAYTEYIGKQLIEVLEKEAEKQKLTQKGCHAPL